MSACARISQQTSIDAIIKFQLFWDNTAYLPDYIECCTHSAAYCNHLENNSLQLAYGVAACHPFFLQCSMRTCAITM